MMIERSSLSLSFLFFFFLNGGWRTGLSWEEAVLGLAGMCGLAVLGLAVVVCVCVLLAGWLAGSSRALWAGLGICLSVCQTGQ